MTGIESRAARRYNKRKKRKDMVMVAGWVIILCAITLMLLGVAWGAWGGVL